MYQVDKNAEITAALVKDMIDWCEKHRGRYDRLDHYYGGHHDIMERKKDGEALKNNRVMINHAKYITDVAVGYLLGNPIDYQVNQEINIDPILDAYKKQTMENLDVEIAKECSIFGHKFEYIYADEEANPRSVGLDVRNTVIAYDNTMVHGKVFGMNYRPVFTDMKKKKPDYFEVVVGTDKEIIKFKLKEGTLTELDREEHYFDEVPFIEYKNNGELQGDFEPVISLIDAYNLIQSDRVNDREQLVDAILCFYGMDFDVEQMADLKAHRALSDIPTDGKVEYLTKTINEADVDVLRSNIEKDIHKISMIPNMSDENFAGNASGVALRYKLLTFEQSTKNKERFFEKALMERFRLYNNYLVHKSTMEKVGIEEVDAIFNRNLPSNDYELSQMIVNLRGLVDDELLVGQLSFVDNAAETVAIAKEQAGEQREDDYNANNFGQDQTEE